ncbi:hypothetical protein Droror1_Dr00007482 [Drosera rotundifolia]
MGFRFHQAISSSAKQIISNSRSLTSKTKPTVPRGHFAVYIGNEERKRYVIPLSSLNNPSFQAILNRAEREYGFNQPNRGLTLPCDEEELIHLTCQLGLHLKP